MTSNGEVAPDSEKGGFAFRGGSAKFLPTAATLNADEFGGLPPRLTVPFHPESALLFRKYWSRSSPTLEVTRGSSQLMSVAFSSSGYGGKTVCDSVLPRPATTRRGSGVVKYSGGYASMTAAPSKDKKGELERKRRGRASSSTSY